MKQIIIFSVMIFLVACAPGGNEDKKAELQKYKDLVKEYNLKISELTKELDSIPQTENSQITRTSVEVKEMQPEVFTSYFESKGKLEAVNDAYISPEISGQVKSIVVERGKRVRKGQLLISLNTEVTNSNIREVKTNLELAEKVFLKQKQLWEKQIGSEIQFLEAKNRKESLEARLATLESQLALSYIRAPFDGIIEDIMVKTGELASPGVRLLRLVNLDHMRVTAQVSESFLSNVSEGEIARISFSSLPELTLEESIDRVGKVIDPVTRTFTIELLISNKQGDLRPNMLCSVRVQDYFDPSALLVPTIVLKEDFEGTFLFVVGGDKDDSNARKVYVEKGKTVQDQTKIVDGLNEGDKVIVRGYNLVSDGEKVKIIN